MPAWMSADLAIQASYFVTAVLFIMGLKRMSSPVTARSGILWAGAGMLVATLITFLYPGMSNYGLILPAMLVGAVLAWWSGKRVAMTNIPQMIALYNGMGGGAAAAIAAVELYRGGTEGYASTTLAVAGGIIGAVSFSGSLIAFGKLQGLITRSIRFRGQQLLNLLLLAVALVLGALVAAHLDASLAVVTGFFLLALLLGLTMTLPIGGADMPVVISLLNSYAGLAAASTGFVLSNNVLIIAGALDGASGFLLSVIMSKAMNRSFTNVVFGAFGAVAESAAAGATAAHAVNEGTDADAATVLDNAQSLIVVPGYGMAVAQAQHAVRDLTRLLEQRGTTIKYAVHPVAGRMPGHMNVLLAEADVPYDQLYDLDAINDEFAKTDVALVVGANDVVNPAAKTNPRSPIYGMPVLNVDQARTVIVLKRSMNPGFAGIENELFVRPNTLMVFGDAKTTLNRIIAALKR